MAQYARNEAVTIGASSAEVSPPKTRTGFIIRNISTAGQTISLFFGDGTAVANQGIVLNVNDYIADSNSEGYICWQGQINAISSAIGGNLSIMER